MTCIFFKSLPLILNPRRPVNLKSRLFVLTFNLKFSEFKFISSVMTAKKEFKRLPKKVLPVNYALTLKPNVQKFTFDGHTDISVKVHEATDEIILNSVDTIISEIKYTGSGQDFHKEIAYSFSEDDETVTIKFPSTLKVGDGILSISYLGQLNDKMKGFYRSKYTTPDGEVRYGGSTQFESTYARLAFPCWDEPAIKATFDVTMVVPKDRVALSNMPVVSEKDLDIDASYKVVSYMKTPIMSTYLLAFVVGEYDFVEAKDADGVLVRVYTPQNKKEQGLFALDVAVKTLPFYKEYFKVAYPLPKMDLIAIADFASGAMENWGLVTYRENALLIDEASSSVSTKQRVALVVGHELAHQWFGNLVTMEWWTHLWLNEGFASWIEYMCVDHIFPEFDIWTQFASSDFSQALSEDALKNSHAIEIPVGHPSEIDEIFDAISYSKGASIIRMLHDFMGDSDFRKGMNHYLTKHQYKNTFTEDLWESLEISSGKPINSIMSTWTVKMGYPVIKIDQVVGDKSRQITLKQERFIADGSEDESDSQWLVPITICSASSPTKPIHQFILNKTESTFTIEVPKDDWIKLNCGGIGFYRSEHSKQMINQLAPAIYSKALSPRDRLSMENDLFALARSGKSEGSTVLKLLESYKNEDDFTVWVDINQNLAQLFVLYQEQEFYDHFKAYNRQLFEILMEKLGWDSKEAEGPLVTMLRGLVVGRLGRSGNEKIIAEAQKRYEEHVSGKKLLPGDLRNAVYNIAIKNGGLKEYEQMLKLYKKSDLQEEKVRCLRSLGASSDVSLIKRTLEFSIGDEVRSQDTLTGIFGTTGSLEGREMAWQFVKDKWDFFNERYKGGFMLPRLVKITTEDFVSEKMAKDVENFFEDNPTPAAERSIKQCLENIRLNAQQLSRDIKDVKPYLLKFA